jgi:hypothetical protein
MTIYNKYVDPSTRSEKWQRTQILAVAWENRKAANVRAMGGALAADQASVYIPFERGANYEQPRAWLALVDKSDKWTLKEGDIIVKGLVADEIHDAVVDPPSAAFTVTMLKAKYDDVLTISSVDTRDMGSLNMQHWQIGAR